MKTFINEHNPKDFLPVDEFIEYCKEVLAEFRAANGLDEQPETTPVVADAASDEPPGDDAPPGDKENEESAPVRPVPPIRI